MSCLYRLADRYKAQKAVKSALNQNLKSPGRIGRAGSSPAARTILLGRVSYFHLFKLFGQCDVIHQIVNE